LIVQHSLDDAAGEVKEMHILFWIIVGIIAGALAKAVVPGEGPGGILGDLIIGIAGAFLGGWLFTLVAGHSYGGWIGSTLVAFIGAVILLLIIRALTTRRVA
jgi:uncharacterized membrane protein YeaQ/YmgE (transglycosylase-associated protein family)